jgi:acetyl-CoA acyltransferase
MVAHTIDALLDRNAAVDPGEVEDVTVGIGDHVGEQGGNMARLAVVLSKLPITTAATTINRFCSSGVQSVAFAANQIASGQTEVAMAGGVESISMHARQTAPEYEMNPRLLEEKPDIFMAMGNTAEVVARRYNVSRETQDKYALQSQSRYAHAAEQGWIADEIVPMTVTMKVVDKESGEESLVETVVDRDECNRPGTTMEGLSGLKPAFEESGTVTAGNASQLSDGASMTLLMSADRASQLGLEPIGIFRGFTVAACEPDEMGIGPVFSVPRLLKNAGLSMNDINLWELNEAFASQCVYCRDRLGIDNEIYNVNGGSISIGHPFGMTGSRMIGALLRELKRRSQKLGVVTMCVGGGQGASGLFEAV